MTIYPTYKDSGIKWLGQIPTHWEVRKIKNCLQERSEKGYPNEPILCATQSRGVIPHDMYDNRVVVVNKDFDKLKLVKCGDFVISLRSFQGGIEYAYYQGIISAASTILTPKNKHNRDSFKHLFKSHDFIQLLQTCVTGIREGQNINYDMLAKHFVPVPPQEEQRQIVAYLDYKSNKINERICQRERELQTLSELKQAEIAAVVTRGLDPNVPMKESGIEWIGQIPAHWEIKYLSQIAEEHYISNKNVHHQNLLSLSYGRIVRKDINTTEGLLPASFDTYQVIEKGNIILRLTGLQNDHKSLRIGLVTEEGIITSAYICIQSRQAILPEYLYLLLHSYDICNVFYGMGGGLRQSLSYADIKRIPIIIPAISEQVEIIKHINAKTKNIDIYMESLKKEIELLQEYKQRLISDVVTGKVDVRGVEIPNEE